MTAGYNVGGPIFIPDTFNTAKDKLFFFMSHEWNGQLVPPVPRRVRVPTLAERQGDFSASTDASGVPVIIRDPQTGQPFQGNIIQPNRFSPYGQAVLNWLPPPNLTGNTQHNYESQVAQDLPSFDQVYRFDYNINTHVESVRSDLTQQPDSE